MLNPERKAMLVAALRSGEYKQVKGSLHTEEGFCCLGVACDVYRKVADPTVEWNPPRTTENKYMFLGSEGYLPEEVADWFSFSDICGNLVTIEDVQTNLMDHNDHGKTFEQIADAIESQL